MTEECLYHNIPFWDHVQIYHLVEVTLHLMDLVLLQEHPPGKSLSFEHVTILEDIVYRQPPPRGERQELMERRRESYHHPYHETHFPRTPLHAALPPSPPFSNDMSTPLLLFSPPFFSREDHHFFRRERRHSSTPTVKTLVTLH